MLPTQIKCPTCLGRKKVYRIMGGGYCHINSGGSEVECRKCEGAGTIENPQFIQNEVPKKLKTRKQKEEITPEL